MGRAADRRQGRSFTPAHTGAGRTRGAETRGLRRDAWKPGQGPVGGRPR